MTPNRQNQNIDLLDQAIQSLRETPIPPEPPFEAVHAVLDAAPDNPRFLQRSLLLRHLNSIIKIAAVLIFSLGGLTLLVWLQNRNDPQADYLRIVQPLLNAQTATCQITVDAPGVPTQNYSTMFKAPDWLRHSISGGAVQIVHVSQGRMLTLTPSQFIAVEVEISSPPRKQGHLLEIKKAIQQTLQNESTVVHFVEEKQIDGPSLRIYRIAQDQMDMTLCADPDTLQLIRLEAVLKALNHTEKIVISNFEFDVPLDDSLFSFEIPKYYTAFTLALGDNNVGGDLPAFWNKIKNISGQQFSNPQNLSTIMNYINPLSNQMLYPNDKQQLLQMPLMIPMMNRLLIL